MTTQIASHSDAQLVESSLTGNRSAFGTIVKRYQSLVCSITYNATGSLSLSEDLAQETFLAAWKQLPGLREPARLRSWLCGITRFLVGKELRRQGREPIHAAEALDGIQEPASLEASPAVQAVSREEEAILWRALERIPAVYREPLILFYREEKSIERVAAEMDLSEDAVKQRLSRGRKLLHEEVAAFVEGTLSRSAPGQDFSSAVLAMLPAAPLATAAAGMASKGVAMAKSGSAAMWLVPLAPFVGILGAVMTNWLSVRSAPTARERRFQTIAFIGLWAFVVIWAIAGQAALVNLRYRFAWSGQSFYAVMMVFWWIYAIFVATFTIVFFRRIVAMRLEDERTAGIRKTPAAPTTLASNIGMTAGVYIALFSCLIYFAWRAHDWVTAIIVAGIAVVLGIWHFIHVQSCSERSAMRAAIGHICLDWAVVLAILNLRLDVWLAASRGTSVAEIHRLLPVWVMPLGTFALVIWVGVMVAVTGPKASALEPAGR
ncbi:MAG: sigma-70 family RNA polymerase sigma factor [Terracidiphilus sp.]|jgi:RNA polymerase sigma factor (sigma-70 family)